MALTVDCGEGKHDLCSGTGRVSYLFPQESRHGDEPDFFCGCVCHHNGTGVPCADPKCDPTTRTDFVVAIEDGEVIAVMELPREEA